MKQFKRLQKTPKDPDLKIPGVKTTKMTFYHPENFLISYLISSLSFSPLPNLLFPPCLVARLLLCGEKQKVC